MPRQRPPRFKVREIVHVVANERTIASGLAGLTGHVCGHGALAGGGWDYGVLLPRRRRTVYGFGEHEIESTDQWEPAEKGERTSIRIRVDPESGTSTVLDADGEPVEFPPDDDNAGLEFFTEVHVEDLDDPDADRPPGVIVAKAQHPDGSWRYGVLVEDEQAVRTVERRQFWAHRPTDPGEYLDRHERPDTSEVEREVALLYHAVWQAPQPAYGYDQYVRVLDRPHTEPVVGRMGRVIIEELRDDLTWSYFVYLDDDPEAAVQYLTAGEEDIEATGEYGEGYNAPPDWRR